MVHRIPHATGLVVALTGEPAGTSGQAGPRPLHRANVLPSFGDGVLQPRASGGEASAAPRARAALPSAASAAPALDASPARTDALARLGQVRDRFVALLQGNWSPGKMDKVFDAAMMPTLVAAENARQPGLQLTLIEDHAQLKAWLRADIEEGARRRALFSLPGFEDHFVVADVRRKDGRTSVLVADSLDPSADVVQTYEASVLTALRRLLPARATLSMLALGAQQSDMGCRIFSLSFASKLAADKDDIDKLHDQNLPGASLQMGTFPALSRGGSRQARLFEGASLIPQPFMKHAQSRTAIQQWQAEHPSTAPDVPVNSEGQTLLSRHEAHRVERHAPADATKNGKPVKPLNFSASIEQKRITYMNRALDYLRTAPESECQGLLDRLEASGITEGGIAQLGLEGRFWGPPRT
jgi:hypothetical protein